MPCSRARASWVAYGTPPIGVPCCMTTEKPAGSPMSWSSRPATVLVTQVILSRAHATAARSAARALGDVRRDVADLRGRQRVAERRHRPAAALDLCAHLLVAGTQRVETRAETAGAAGRGERVAAAAACRLVDARAGGGV